MNREKDKTNAAVEYAKQFDLGPDYNIAFDSFIEGTRWADEHHRAGLVDMEFACKYWETVLTTWGLDRDNVMLAICNFVQSNNIKRREV